MSATGKRNAQAGKLTRNLSAGQMHQHADEAVAVLKAMASHNRLLLLCQLVQGERSVGALAQSLELAQSVVSQHLSLLRRDGVVSARREAQTIYYQLTSGPTKRIISELHDIYCDIESGSRARKRSSNRG